MLLSLSMLGGAYYLSAEWVLHRQKEEPAPPWPGRDQGCLTDAEFAAWRSITASLESREEL